MRFFTTLGLAVAALVLFGTRTANAAPLDNPQGSYRDTCKNVKLRGDTLRARCKDLNHHWQDSSLEDVNRCVGDIANVNGELRCNKENRDVRDGRAPNGAYSLTCRDIKVRGDSLRARCQDRYGSWIDAALDDFRRCRSEIVNDNGRLSCDRDDNHYGGGQWPRGSYVQTCRDIQVREDSLRAHCQQHGGDWRDTSLEDYRRCTSDIVNDDGHLRCAQSGGGSVPPGSYTRTCREISVNGDTLRASCERSDGRWNGTTLRDWRQCREITNIEGELRCSR